MEQVITNFYEAFAQLDAQGMVKNYHPDIVFEDPAFGILKGKKAAKMWEMLCESQKGKDFVVQFSAVKCDNNKGSAHWEAIYTFSKTGRKVHNIIDAEFEFKDGKIIKHTDNFNLYKWAKQAFGISGFFIGWTPFFRKKLNAQTNLLLTKFMNK